MHRMLLSLGCLTAFGLAAGPLLAQAPAQPGGNDTAPPPSGEMHAPAPYPHPHRDWQMGQGQPGQSQNSGQTPGPQPGSYDHTARLTGMLSEVQRGLALTPAQQPLWQPFSTAVVNLAESEHMARPAAAADLPQWIDRDAQRALARGAALQQLSGALQPLYATLSDDQKHYIGMALEEVGVRLPHLAMGMHEHGQDPMSGDVRPPRYRDHGGSPDGGL